MTVTSTTSPEERSYEEIVRKKRKRMRVSEEPNSSRTNDRLAQELPNCNWLEKKIKMETGMDLSR